MKASELKTKMDFITWLKEHGVTKLPQGWSIKDAVDAIEHKDDSMNRYNDLMEAQP